MDLSNRYSRLECRDLRLIEYRFHMYSKKSGFRKLQLKFKGDPTVVSKVMALSKPVL
jgi:hypothetical protein